MQKFRVQSNVPDVYTSFSRDFQLLCNVYDVVYNGVRFDISTMCDILDTRRIKENMLPYLQSKLGFFTVENFTAPILRTILLGFRDMIRYKGTLEGIYQAVYIYLHVLNVRESVVINVINKSQVQDYIIEIKINGQLKNIEILKSLLDYVIPTSYRIVAAAYVPSDHVTSIEQSDTFNLGWIESRYNDTVYNPDNANKVTNTLNEDSNVQPNRVSTSGVISKEDLTDGQEV